MIAVAVIATVCGVLLGMMIVRIAERRTGARGSITGPIVRTSDIEREVDADLARGLRSAVDRLQMGVVMCDGTLSTTYRNDAADTLAGTHGGVIVDHHLQQVFEQSNGGQPASRVVELQGPPKVTYVIESMPIPDGGVVATITDISERVRIDSMRTDFVANISHELKTPVGAIAVLAEMLADERDLETISSLSNRIVDESLRAARTIDDLLELSRIEAGHDATEIVDVADVVDEAVARGRMVADGRPVEVSSIDTETTVFVRGDRRQLVSAIGNLVENAVKYSDERGQVQVRIRRDERGVEVMVADQGVGIPPRDIDRIFERFYRVDKARARGTGGTGLGLAIVRHVVNNHGGSVSVSSELGEGSTFALRLPARLIVEPDAVDRLDPPVESGGDDATNERTRQ